MYYGTPCIMERCRMLTSKKDARKSGASFYLGTSSRIGVVSGEGDDEEEVKKKSIAIFTYKHSVFSLDMKTKVDRHVSRIT